MSTVNFRLGSFALSERLRNRLDRRAFFYSASIESMKKERAGWIIVLIPDRPETHLVFHPIRFTRGGGPGRFFNLLKVGSRKMVPETRCSDT